MQKERVKTLQPRVQCYEVHGRFSKITLSVISLSYNTTQTATGNTAKCEN